MFRNRHFFFVGITFFLTASVSAPAFAQYHEYSSGLPQVEVDLSVLDDANVEKQIQKNFDPSTHTTVPPVAPVIASPLPSAQPNPYDKFKRPPYTLQDKYGDQPAVAAPVEPIDPVDSLAPIGAPQVPTAPVVATQDTANTPIQPVAPAEASAWMSARPEPRKRLLKPAPSTAGIAASPNAPVAPQDTTQKAITSPATTTLPATVAPAVSAPVISRPFFSHPTISRPDMTQPIVTSQPPIPALPAPERPIVSAPVVPTPVVSAPVVAPITKKPAAVLPPASPVAETPHKDKATAKNAQQEVPAVDVKKQPEPEYAPVMTEDAPDAGNTADIPPVDVTDEIVSPQTKKTENTDARSDIPTDNADTPKTAAVPVVPTLADLTVSFQGNTSDLDADGMTKLDNIVAQLKTAGSRLQVRAYATGEDGSKSSARRISLSRALSVRSYLMDKGIKPNRVDVRALGTDTDKSPLDRVDLVFAK